MALSSIMGLQEIGVFAPAVVIVHLTTTSTTPSSEKR